jgi:hypothetical protein
MIGETWEKSESGATDANAGIPAPTTGKSNAKPKKNRSKGAPRDSIARREGPALEQTVAMLHAHRIPLKKIGRVMQRDWKTVKAILGKAETQRMVEDYRQFLKGHAMSEALKIQRDGFTWVKETLANREAKEFDLVTRGMSNLERIYASAAGEGQKAVQVAQVNVSGETPTQELKALLSDLLAKP